MRDNIGNMPDWVLDSVHRLDAYAKTQGWKDWFIGPVVERAYHEREVASLKKKLQESETHRKAAAVILLEHTEALDIALELVRAIKRTESGCYADAVEGSNWFDVRAKLEEQLGAE
jgi:hypothetical protein